MRKFYLVVLLLSLLLASSIASESTNKQAQGTAQKIPKANTQAPESNTNKTGADDFNQVREFLNSAAKLILDDRIFEDNTIWVYPPHLGLRFIGEYFVAIHYLGLEKQSAFNTETYKQIALSTQLENGSWKQLPDPLVTDGQIDSTIEAYWALKIMGEDINAPHMKKAREWILNYGGIEKAATLTKYFLALCGQYDWESMVYIPLIVLRNDSLFSYTFADNFVAQWVYPHIVAMSYLRYYKIGKDMGPRFSLQELYLSKPQSKLYDIPKPLPEPDPQILHIIKLQLGIQQHNGGFGAYTVSSLLNMAALQDFSAAYPHLLTNEIRVAIKKAFDYLEYTYITAPRAGYKGMLMDGSLWDNVLIVNGLISAKVPAEKLTKTMDYIIKKGQQPNGGFCYGAGFEYAPDTDDTALAVQTMLKFGDRYKAEIKKAVDWLVYMQNDDGGFGAFHRNKNTNKVISMIAGKIADSAEIFDQSSVDLTTHVIEAWADYGYDCSKPFVQKAIAYIKREQTSFGSWEARWATNYIHTAGYVLSSLSRIGYNMSEPWIKKAVKWILSKQNQDGGWGETFRSYNDINLAGVGVSTPTHTSWVLLGLIQIADKEDYSVSDNIFRAIEFLQKAHAKNGGEWLDESPVGTGHRGILAMQYPAYAKSFPLMAISRFSNKFGEGKACSSLNNYCRKTVIECLEPEYENEL